MVIKNDPYHAQCFINGSRKFWCFMAILGFLNTEFISNVEIEQNRTEQKEITASESQLLQTIFLNEVDNLKKWINPCRPFWIYSEHS